MSELGSGHGGGGLIDERGKIITLVKMKGNSSSSNVE
jgi:hypothetical protein